MKSFLQYVAEDIVKKHGTNLSRIAVVFPNKRASLFMNEYLARQADRPIWSPAYITISDLFRRHSKRQVADPIKLVCDLHKCFIEQTGIDETLDHFYGWGQLLIADFDDLDKNMADADKVLANLSDLNELDDINYLSEEQKAVIRRFFSNFNDDHNSLLKQRFLQLWSKMGNIYHAFNHSLEAQGLGYEGAIYREVALQDDIDFRYDTYIFVGFNLIQPVEQQLFMKLKKEGRARFYWDFDHYYMSNNEAGHYIAQYLADFPNELDSTNNEIYRQFATPKEISYVAAPTENIQARYISTWLRESERFQDGRRTAIVLCNENLLQTVIHSLPKEVDKVNVTTGFPLMQSPAASLVIQLFALQTMGYDQQRACFRLRYVNSVLRHPYAVFISSEAAVLHKELNEQKIYYPSEQRLGTDDSLALLFKHHSNNEQLLNWLCTVIQHIARKATNTDPLFQESVFRTYTLLNRLHGLTETGDLQVDVITLQRLLMQLINSTSVPFHGEPAEGIQVMGVLETRNIDFDHVLLLSCNEGNLPKGVNDTSFIPYNIRKAYGLTTIDHKISIYSYYFHRLLQRAKDVTILYNNATTDGQTGEMSRFMLQLMVESPHKIQFKTILSTQSFSPFAPQAIKKSNEVMERIIHHFTPNTQESATIPLLTPTAINRYMRCPLQFYYRYACGLIEPDETDDDTIDNRIFGNIFHEASRIIYSRLMEKSHEILAKDLKELLRQKVDIERAVDQAFTTELFKLQKTSKSRQMELNGLQIINREVIIHYIRQLLQVDIKLAPFHIIGLECDVMAPLHCKNIRTTIGGRIDRLDCVRQQDGNYVIRVIDYKTGSSRLKPLADIKSIFSDEDGAKHTDYYLQTFLYGCLVRSSRQYNAKGLPVSPALLFIQHAGGDDYDPVLFFGKERINDVADYSQEFRQLLIEKIEEIFDANRDFVPTSNRNRCEHCPYRQLCRADSVIRI